MAQQDRNPILEAIVKVVEHGESPAALQELVSRARAEMAVLRQEVQSNFDGLDAHVQSACANDFEQVNLSLNVYEDGLVLIELFFQDNNINTLTRGGESVRRGNHLVNEMLLNFRNNALAAMGPTNIPDYNLLHSHYLRVQRGEARDRGFANLVDRFWNQCGIAGEEVFGQPPSEVRDTLLALYRRHFEALKLLKKYVEEGREELLEKGMVDVRETFTELRDTLPQMQMKLRSGVPTRMPVVNFVINMAVEVAGGRMGDKVLQDALEQLRDLYNSMNRQFESVARGHIDSVLISEEAQKVRAAFEEMSTAIGYLDRYFDERRAELLLAGSNALVAAADQLHRSYETFQEIADREGKTLCVKCSHYNEKSRRTCEKCGAMLLQAAETGVASTFQYQVGDAPAEGAGGDGEIPMPDNVRRIFEAVNKVAEAEISLEDFATEIAWLEGVVEEHSHAYTRPVINIDTVPAEKKEEVRRLMALNLEAERELQEGADSFRRGLALYRQFIDDANKDNLTEGTRIIWEGARLLHSVQQKMAPLKEHVGQ